MPYKDAEKRKDYQRQYQRQRRAGITESKPSNLDPTFRLQTAQDVHTVLTETLFEVKQANADTLVKARCIGYLAGIILKAIEAGDIEERIKRLEAKL